MNNRGALNCSEIPNNSDVISRQQAFDALRAMQTYKLFAGDDMLLIDQAEAQTELMMLPSVQPEQRWIPVSEALPEEYSECLVTYKSDGDQMLMDIVEYEPSFEFDHEKNRFKGNWLFADDCRSVNPEVLAWKPLPEYYQEGGE